jgi:hypothetical protein
VKKLLVSRRLHLYLALLLFIIPAYGTVPPRPASIFKLKIHNTNGEPVIRALSIAGLDAHLVCFYGSNHDSGVPELIGNCQNTAHELLFSAWTLGNPPTEVDIVVWTRPDYHETCEATRVVQGFLKGQSGAEIIEHSSHVGCAQ